MRRAARAMVGHMPLGKWSAIAMLELQRIQFAGWALTKGQHQPKAGKKKKTREAGLFFSGSRFILDVPSGSGYNRLFPVRHIYLSMVHPY